MWPAAADTQGRDKIREHRGSDWQQAQKRKIQAYPVKKRRGKPKSTNYCLYKAFTEFISLLAYVPLLHARMAYKSHTRPSKCCSRTNPWYPSNITMHEEHSNCALKSGIGEILQTTGTAERIDNTHSHYGPGLLDLGL